LALLAVAVGLAGANVYGAQASVTETGVNGQKTENGSYYISPYTGTISSYSSSAGNANNGTENIGNGSVTLYCDDFNNDFSVGETATNENITAVVGAASYANTRFGGLTTVDVNTSDGGPGSYTVPTATALYEQLAWLYNELANATGNTTQMEAIQQAAFDIDDPTTVNSATGSGDSSTIKSDASAWVTLAKTDYSAGTLSGTAQGVALTTTNYANWFIVDSSSTSTCNANTCASAAGNSSETQGSQEFLVYNGLVSGGQTVTTPEPATFGLMGIALLIGGYAGRRKKA
jgi:hypothetical protein